jgi:hypothetical protein
MTWASLLERTFAIDILSSPECGGRLRLIATITDTPARGFHPPQGSGGRVRRAGHAVITKILDTSAGSLWSAGHLGLPTEAPAPRPAQVPGWLPGIETPPIGSLPDPPERACAAYATFRVNP